MKPENQNVIPLPHVDLEKIARVTSGVEPLRIPASTKENTHTAEREQKSKKLGKWIAAGALALVSANWLGGGMTEENAPQHEKTLLEHAKDAPKKSIEINDKSVVFTVKVNKNETPAEAVFKDNQVKEYMIVNPDETDTIETSANSLGSTTNEVALVEQDLDGDGDKDTFVAPIEKQ